jgi:uncharacterized protein YndB with AHSA1/START domain
VGFKIEVDVDAAPDEVWATLVDVEAWPKWTASMTSVERLEQGEFGVGSRARVTQPKLKAAVYTVTELAPGESFIWETKALGVTTSAGHRVRPRGDGLATITLRVTQTGALAPLVGLVAATMIRRYVTMEAEGLKRRCEAAA